MTWHLWAGLALGVVLTGVPGGRRGASDAKWGAMFMRRIHDQGVVLSNSSVCNRALKGIFPDSGARRIASSWVRGRERAQKWNQGTAPSGTVAFPAQRLLTKPKLALRPGHGLRGDLMHVAAFVNGIAPLIGIDHLLRNRLLANGAAYRGG